MDINWELMKGQVVYVMRFLILITSVNRMLNINLCCLIEIVKLTQLMTLLDSYANKANCMASNVLTYDCLNNQSLSRNDRFKD